MARLDLPAAAALAVIAGTLGISALLWLNRRRAAAAPPRPALPAWNIGWVNFGLFLWAMLLAVYLCQSLALLIYSRSQEVTPWDAVVGFCSLQLPMLAVFYGGRRLFPGVLAGSLNRENLSAGEALIRATGLFFRFVPLVWIVNFGWAALLALMARAGILDEIEPQMMIEVLAGDRQPAARLLLVVFAVAVAPAIEELIFRGCFYRFLKSRLSVHFSIILSALAFALMHGSLFAFAPLFVLGLVLAAAYEAGGNILVPMVFHSLFNTLTLVLLFLSRASAAIDL